MTDDDRYLWDRQGPPDADVEALERLLAPLGHDGRPLARAASSPPERRRGGFFLAAAAVLGCAAIGLSATREPPRQPAIRIATRGTPLRSGEWFTATADHRQLALGDDLGDLTFDEGSRVQVRRLAESQTRLYLERGGLRAFVSARARPRFFQVETPATTCVDLGCAYRLEVAPDGAATVVVESGRVVFESEGREVYVPSGATCRARRDTGHGTPRFLESPPELVRRLDAFDAAARAPAAERRELARLFLAEVTIPRHTLAVWHLLGDPDGQIAIAARDHLGKLFGKPPGASFPATPPDAAERGLWQAILMRSWGRGG